MLELAITNLRPRPRRRLLDWCRDNVQTGEGRPYDHSAYPHIGAPGGPMDAFDCNAYLSIWLQWASRLGKSFFGQCATMKTADCDPCPMMFASSDQKLAVEVTARTYRMLAKCPALRGQLRPEHRRKQDLIDLDACRCYVAWARSVSTLADKAVRVGHANEIDKWEHASTAKEADPLKLFSDRFKEFPRHKKIFESTPAMKHSSRIERGRLGSTNCSYWVPCPHCRRYQTLAGSAEAPLDRIVWDKPEGGRSDKDLARRTARYICKHCSGEVKDQHRGPMMRAGVWVPEGCGVDDAKAAEIAAQIERKPFAGWSLAEWVTGTPVRDGRDAGYQLSSLYALSLTWGDIAAEFIDCQRNVQNHRNFVNQWLAETWSSIEADMTWEKLGKRLICSSFKRFELPEWASLVTLGVDAQEDATRLPWVVLAWGPGRQHAAIAYGESESLAQIQGELFGRTYGYADGKGAPLRLSFALVDSGHRPAGIYEFCSNAARNGHQIYPCKGSSTALEADYVVSRLGQNTSMPGMTLVRVDTIRTQCWIQRALLSLDPADGGAQVHAGSLSEHQDLLEQLLNDGADTDLDSSNNERERWQRIDENLPNDFRDCWRYAFVAMLIATRGAEIRPRTEQQAPRRSAVISAGDSRPDGRPW